MADASIRRARAHSVAHRAATSEHLMRASADEHEAAQLDAELDTVKGEIADHRHEALHAPVLAAALPMSLREGLATGAGSRQERQERRADPWLGSMFSLNSLRGVVSLKKRRFQRDGFDLDLSYITPQIVAMGFPSVGTDATYRNPMSEVQGFFRSFHPGHYKVYNLCCERGYPATDFERAAVYPFMDHNPPPLTLLFDVVEAVYSYVNSDHRNVAAIHCKAGKGRTGVVICCFLLRCGEHMSAADALLYYGVVRTSNGKGVTIASQQRYITYYSQIVAYGIPREVLASPVARTLVGFRVRGTPKGGCNGMFFKVEQDVSCAGGEQTSNKWKSTGHQGNSLRSAKEDVSTQAIPTTA